MARFRPSKFTLDDVPGAPNWIGGLLAKLNQLSTGLTSVFTNQLTFTENMAATIIPNVRVTIPEPSWVAVSSFLNAWINYSVSGYEPAGYRILPGGMVQLKGLVEGGTWAFTSTGRIFQLPAGYRPAKQIGFATEGGAVAAVGRVDADGYVYAGYTSVATPTFFFLDGVSFQAATPCAMPPAFTGEGWPIRVFHRLPERPRVVLPVGVFDETPSEGFSIGAPSIDWDHVGDNAIRIKAIHGLTPGRTYKINLLVVSR